MIKMKNLNNGRSVIQSHGGYKRQSACAAIQGKNRVSSLENRDRQKIFGLVTISHLDPGPMGCKPILIILTVV